MREQRYCQPTVAISLDHALPQHSTKAWGCHRRLAYSGRSKAISYHAAGSMILITEVVSIRPPNACNYALQVALPRLCRDVCGGVEAARHVTVCPIV
jgi:hypothetical protein